MSLTLFTCLLALFINQSFACDCGKSTGYVPPAKSEGKLSRFPWYAVIKNKDEKVCGASLIDDQHIAVAAHCLTGSEAASLKITLNDNSTKSVSSIWIDERYNENDGAYDFAVLTLDSPVNSQLSPICLREPEQFAVPASYLISPDASGENVEGYASFYGGLTCDSPAAKTHLCTMNFGKKSNECTEGPYMANEVNARFYLAGVTSRCGSHGKSDLFTDSNLFNEKIRELAPKGCWKNRQEFN